MFNIDWKAIQEVYAPILMLIILAGFTVYVAYLRMDNKSLTTENEKLLNENLNLLSLNTRNDQVCRDALEHYDEQMSKVVIALENERKAHNKVKILASEVELKRFEKPEGNYSCSISYDATDPVLRRLNND